MPRWSEIKTKLPRKDGVFLVAKKLASGWRTSIAKFTKETKKFTQSGKSVSATHWRPIPKPPPDA
jgi:hypothetical protein